MEIKAPKTRRLSGLEALRGLAALSLVVFHTRFLPPLEVPGWMNALISTFGSGVPLFYAISAFSLLVGYEHALDTPEGLRKFFLRRFFRIAPLFYTMLIVWLCVRQFHFHAPTKGRDVLINAVFIFGLLPGQHEGLVWASWSIGVEWIFYALFPLFLVLARTRLSASVLFVVALIISASTKKFIGDLANVCPSFVYMCFPNHLAFFAAGVLAYRLARPQRDSEAVFLKSARRWLGWPLLGGTVLWLWFGWFGPGRGVLDHIHLAGHWSAFAWMALLVGTFAGMPWLLDNPALRHAGRLSFGLYLINPPIIYSLGKLGLFNWIFQRVPSEGWAFFLSSLIAIAVVAAVSQVAFMFIESPGIQLGERIWQRLRDRRRDEPKPGPDPTRPLAQEPVGVAKATDNAR